MKAAARLNEFGQSAWLDLIGRKLIHSGELKRMAEEDGVRGVIANPAIFEKAIVESNEYDDELSKLIAQGKSNKEIAVLLDISVNTVAVHRARLMETLGLHRTAEIVLYAVKKGLIQPQ